MIEGKSVRLRPWKDADVPTMREVRNDVALQAQLLARARGSDESQVRKWLQDRSSGPDSALFIVADRQTDAALGFVQFTGIDATDRRTELGVCIVPRVQGRGIGTEALTLAFDHIRGSLGLRKVTLRVRADNAGAIRCYSKLGFEECGRLREHFSFAGAWHDVLLMELFFDRPG